MNEEQLNTTNEEMFQEARNMHLKEISARQELEFIKITKSILKDEEMWMKANAHRITKLLFENGEVIILNDDGGYLLVTEEKFKKLKKYIRRTM